MKKLKSKKKNFLKIKINQKFFKKTKNTIKNLLK